VSTDHEPSLAGRYPPWPDAPSGPFFVLRTRRPQFLAQVADATALALSREPHHIDALRRLGPTSAVCVAMMYRGAVVGAMTFARTSGIFRPVHVALLRTLANRVGQTVANGRACEEIRNTGRRKDERPALHAHELRNPLGAITNAVALLQTGKLSRDDEAPIRAIIGRQLRHLTKLVNDLVDVARLSTGKIPVR